jgi:hypothetical protein
MNLPLDRSTPEISEIDTRGPRLSSGITDCRGFMLKQPDATFFSIQLLIASHQLALTDLPPLFLL